MATSWTELNASTALTGAAAPDNRPLEIPDDQKRYLLGRLAGKVRLTDAGLRVDASELYGCERIRLCQILEENDIIPLDSRGRRIDDCDFTAKGSLPFTISDPTAIRRLAATGLQFNGAEHLLEIGSHAADAITAARAGAVRTT